MSLFEGLSRLYREKPCPEWLDQGLGHLGSGPSPGGLGNPEMLEQALQERLPGRARPDFHPEELASSKTLVKTIAQQDRD